MSYRIIPLRTLRATSGVIFSEMAKSDIPRINGIDRVVHAPNSISPGPILDTPIPTQRPWYMHKFQADNLMVVQGVRYVDIFDPKTKQKNSFVISPNEIFKNDKLYYQGPAMLVWPEGIFHRIVSGVEGSISINFSTRTKGFDIRDNFNIYNLCTRTGEYYILRDGFEDQPIIDYIYPSKELENLVKQD